MTFTSLVTALADLAVTGVVKKFTAPPQQIGTAEMPCMYPRLPDGTLSVLTLAETTGLLSAVCELVVVVSPYMQGTNRANFTTCLSLMDALNTALTAAIHANGIDRWTIRQDTDVIGETPYWTIIARVEASG